MSKCFELRRVPFRLWSEISNIIHPCSFHFRGWVAVVAGSARCPSSQPCPSGNETLLGLTRYVIPSAYFGSALAYLHTEADGSPPAWMPEPPQLFPFNAKEHLLQTPPWRLSSLYSLWTSLISDACTHVFTLLATTQSPLITTTVQYNACITADTAPIPLSILNSILSPNHSFQVVFKGLWDQSDSEGLESLVPLRGCRHSIQK